MDTNYETGGDTDGKIQLTCVSCSDLKKKKVKLFCDFIKKYRVSEALAVFVQPNFELNCHVKCFSVDYFGHPERTQGIFYKDELFSFCGLLARPSLW